MKPDEISFFDPDVNRCPYDAYQVLRDEAPVWLDPITGFYVITRYEDVRAIIFDTEHFASGRRGSNRAPAMEARAGTIAALYEEKGWTPAPTLAGRDDPNHKQMRALFDHAFRPSRIRQLDDFVEAVAHRLIDAFIDRGTCDWVREFAVPLPLIVIGMQMGADEEDIWRIKAWTDAWVQRLGMMQTDEEAIWSTEMEIEAQHYFQPIFERLRREPDDTLLSDLVNTVVPEWGRTLNDNELHAEMMADTFVGGSETSTNALSAGVKLLIERPDAWERLKADPGTYLPQLVEETVRLESPVQGLFRVARHDVELHGVTIPAGSTINIRYAAANRDERHFDEPAELDLDRQNSRTHLGFGAGVHHCLGAPLARRELFLGFKALVERIDALWFLTNGDASPRNSFDVAPNFALRALKELHIGFTAARGRPS
jgi:cytochrome P450